ncbi:wall-associated receptor kinase 2 [Quercus suber]|uniref:wall-associated receptor kinase 2 n=1 Tax=Quercus suber TaxID=58331 RepID=UPI000CE289CB|nr:wall-associated receptor kinase 2-like [Quercus suber]
MALREMLLQQLLLLLLGLIILAATEASQPNSNCERSCGSVSIPYPFGTKEGCYHDESFLITCNKTKSGTSKPFLRRGNIPVLNISLDGELRVSSAIAHACYNDSGIPVNKTKTGLSLTKFAVSSTKNKFTAVGCDVVALIRGSGERDYGTGCLSLCRSVDSVESGSCVGIGCCQSPIPTGVTDFTVALTSLNNHSTILDFNPCNFGFVVEENTYSFSASDFKNLMNKTVPVVLDWAVGNETCEDAERNSTSYACIAKNSTCYASNNGGGYRCNCSSGFEGNPYLVDGCKDIDECQNPNPCYKELCHNFDGGFNCYCPKGYEGDGMKNGTSCKLLVTQSKITIIALCISVGLLVLFVGSSWMYWGLKKRKLIKLREKFFQQNGGLLLQQKLSNRKGSVEASKIYSADEIKKATNNYDESRVLGQGGYGIVYKGILPDNKVIAIKKSKIGNQIQIEQFINEINVLTQINHRNVVKLLGCCLETEVPLLVYEFITKGTLSDHIHDKSLSSILSWEKRLKIAAETAGALAYLHSATSVPIIHRDVKAANILLDDNFTAKVSDFGASRLVPLDQTQLNTLVQGTFGYLDPEYFHTSQLTEKSDVYSFGVVLAELLTGKMALSFDRPEIDRNLAMCFVSAVKDDRLVQILEDSIVNEGNIEELKEVANLAKRCLKVTSEDRPSMKEVAMELEGFVIMEKHPWRNTSVYTEETEFLLGAPTQSFSVDVGPSSASSTGIGYDSMRNEVLKPLDDGR